MIAHERLREIARVVAQKKRVSVSSLQKRFGVSAAQMRRDLSHLETSRQIVRLHGAAVHPSFVFGESSHDARARTSAEVKRRIGATAAAMVRDGESVWVDAGTTCEAAARELLGRTGVRIITHSVPVLCAALAARADVISVGGELRPVTGALVGAAALGAMRRLRPDWIFLGATAVEGCGLFTTELSEAAVKEALLAMPAKKMLLADPSKWGAPGPVRFGGWDAIAGWVTGDGLDAGIRRDVAAGGTEIIIAS